MLKYYKDYFSDYLGAELLQTLILIGFVVFFVTLVVVVWRRPKGYYKDTENLPLDDNDSLF